MHRGLTGVHYPSAVLIGIEEVRKLFGGTHLSKLEAVHLALDARYYSHVMLMCFRVVDHLFCDNTWEYL